jgi:phospholipid transport system substrate-binding protein
MRIYRRALLNRAALVVVAGLIASLMPSLSHALSKEAALEHVRMTLEEIAAVVNTPGDTQSKASQLLEIMERRAAMPRIARFAAGIAWREMSDDQQTRFVTAFGKFLSGFLAGRFQEYAGAGPSGETFELGRVIDAGRKGMLVKTTILRTGEAPVVVEWLVSDRPGRIVIADIVIEGISMLITEREEIGSMLEARGGDIEKLIADLSS